METINESLEKLGLSAKAARLYLALLQTGSATVQELSERAGIVRTTCYPLIAELSGRGLVNKTKGGKRTLLVAEPPSRLLELLEEPLSAARALVPALELILSGNVKRPKVEIHEGVSGVWRTYEDIIGGKDYEVKSFVPAEDIMRVAGEEKVRSYIKKRVRKGIHIKALIPKTAFIEQEYAPFDQKELRRTRFLDIKKYRVPVGIDLYPPHNIAVTSFKDGIGLIVRSEPIYETLNSIFELSWQSAEPKTKKINTGKPRNFFPGSQK